MIFPDLLDANILSIGNMPYRLNIGDVIKFKIAYSFNFIKYLGIKYPELRGQGMILTIPEVFYEQRIGIQVKYMKVKFHLTTDISFTSVPKRFVEKEVEADMILNNGTWSFDHEVNGDRNLNLRYVITGIECVIKHKRRDNEN